MNVLENLDFNSNKTIKKEELSYYKGGLANDCCFLFCEGEYMGACGSVPNNLYCSDADIPDDNCEWMEGACTQCLY